MSSTTRNIFNLVLLIIGAILIVGGIVLGLYVGVWICFVGGIIDIVNVVNIMIEQGLIDGLKLGVGIVKMLFASFAGVVTVLICFASGIVLLEKGGYYER